LIREEAILLFATVYIHMNLLINIKMCGNELSPPARSSLVPEEVFYVREGIRKVE
jgi:hypothetical protein